MACGPFAPAALRRVILVLACLLSSGYWYSLSLQDADLRFFRAHVPTHARNLVLATTLYSAAIWATALSQPLTQAQRVALLCLVAGCPLAALAHDHGITMEQHGLYSMLTCVLLLGPVNAVAASSLALYRVRTHAAVARWVKWGACVLALLLVVRLSQHGTCSHRGLAGARMRPRSCNSTSSTGCPLECRWHLHIPWLDLLPHRALNFWTGSHSCPQQPPFRGPYTTPFRASFSPAGLLTLEGCGSTIEGDRYPCRYTVLPHMWEVEKDMARIYSTFSRQLKTRTYTSPVHLPAVEAVLASRGVDEKQLLVRAMDMLPHRPDIQVHPYAGPSSLRPPLLPPQQQNPKQQPKQQDKINVLLLFLDSVSRRQFHRKLPGAYAAMDAVHARGHSNIYEFFRYHSVGWNTNRNSRAMFAGLADDQHNNQTPIWSSYRRNGYMTGYVSNCCNDWSADYNGGPRPDSIDHELLSPFCLPEYYGYHPFKGAYSMARRCLAGRHAHAYNFDYMRSFMQRYDGRAPWFLASVFNEGHEGTGEVLATVDSDLTAFLTGIPVETWNRTVVLILADHGLHMGLGLLFTNAGKVEHMNPFMALMLPPWLGEQVHGAVEGNQQKLVTAWDVYATLNHVLHWPGGEAPAVWAELSGLNAMMVHWGWSLLGVVPAGRSCEGLGIGQYCMCRDMSHRDTRDEL